MGTFAVQIAKNHGAEVTAVDSERKLAMLRKIGADKVLDYSYQDCTKGEDRYDLILDTVAQRSIFDYRRVMSSDGMYVLVGGSKYAIFQALFLGPLISIASKKKMNVNTMRVNNKDDFRFLLELIEKRKIRPVIDRRCSLDEVPGALTDLSKGLVNGKVVVKVNEV